MHEINSTSTHRRVAVIAITALMTISAFLSVASTAALAAPKGVFAVFAQCPTSIPGVAICQYVEITSGELAVGPVSVPIDKTIVFQGGLIHTGSPNPNEYFLLPAANGESISPTELDVPGGLRTIIGCNRIKSRDFYRAFRRRGACREFSHGRAYEDRVTATIEGVASPSNPAVFNLVAIALEKGTGLTFPGRIHLKNPLLGEACYIGSEAHPIELHLTDGTTSPPPPNQPITGKLGEVASEVEGEYEAIKITDNTLVDNTFSVPPAEGCGGHLSSIINPLVNQTLGLESPAGHNTAILTGTHRIAEIEAVLASEAFPTEENPTPPPPPHHHHYHWWWSGH
jgi:hypothetical protein